MKRALLVVAGLILLTAVSSADYVILKINLSGGENSADPNPPGGAGGFYPPMPPGPGGGGGFRPPMPPGPPGGFGGGRPPGGGFGPMPPMPPGGGGAGAPPGLGGGAGAGLGGAGGAGAPPGFPGFPGGPNGGNAEKPEKQQFFVIAVEVDSATEVQYMYNVRHKWGQSRFPPSIGDLVTVTVYDRARFPTVAEPLDGKFFKERTRLYAEEKKKDKEALSVAGNLKLAKWILEHWNLPVDERGIDMRKKFEEIVAQLEKTEPGDAKEKALIKSLVTTRDNLLKPIKPNDQELAYLREVLPGGDQYGTSTSPHYLMLRSSRDETIVPNRLKRLEHVLAGFYYWFALKGKPLPALKNQLVCVQAEDRDAFNRLTEKLEAGRLVADGFYSRFDNVAILSPTRLDAPFKQLMDKANNLEHQQLDMQKLLKADDRLIKDMVKKAKVSDWMGYYGSTIALAVKAAEEEGEIATITHEGVQQAAAATGLLPRRVHVPHAVRFGLGSLFETPKTECEFNPNLPTLWTGLGRPSWAYLPCVQMILANEGREYTLDPKTTTERKVKIDPLSIARILTDKNLLAAEDDKKDKDFYRYKAQSEAWALTYFLAQQNLDQLLAFYRELAVLPRDLELNEDAVMAAFGWAFNLNEPNSDKISPEKLAQLETSWKRFLGFEQIEAAQIIARRMEEIRKQQEQQKKNDNTRPGGPGVPGFPPPGAPPG